MVKWLLTSLAVPPDVLLRLAHVENTGEAEQPSTTAKRHSSEFSACEFNPLFVACDFSSPPNNVFFIPPNNVFLCMRFFTPPKKTKTKKNNPKP